MPPARSAHIHKEGARKRRKEKSPENEHSNPQRNPAHLYPPPPIVEHDSNTSEAEYLSMAPPSLSEKSSRALQSIFKDVMDSKQNSLKRTRSQDTPSSPTASPTASNSSPPFAKNNALYRHQNLAAVRICLHAKPPKAIEAIVKAILNGKCTRQRRGELDAIAEELRARCFKTVKAQTGEDDSVRPLCTAIENLSVEKLCVREKVSWRPELKPIFRPKPYSSSKFMSKVVQPDVGGASAQAPKDRQRSIKRQSTVIDKIKAQADKSQSSSKKNLSTLVQEGRCPIKTPRPDLFIGIDLEALVSALSSARNLDDEYMAEEFMSWAQNEMIQHEPEGLLEPMLIVVPSLLALDLTFPFLVVEGKAYATGKQIFEAENQAAVGVACAHNMLHRLDRRTNLDEETQKLPLVLFSITTQGPIHELWAHWTVLKGGVQSFESKLWDSWNLLVPKKAEDFVLKLENLCMWGTGTFMKSVVTSLEKVMANAIETEDAGSSVQSC